MNLESLQSQLENCNYFTRLVSGTLIIGTHPQTDPDHPEIGFFKAFCSAELRENSFVVEYAQGQISNEETFPDVAKAVDFIKKKFPI